MKLNTWNFGRGCSDLGNPHAEVADPASGSGSDEVWHPAC
jgi:hypothetical protein